MPDSQPYTVIMHDSVTLDGSYAGFGYSPEMMELHYRIAARFGETIRITGSATCTHAIEIFGGFTEETSADRVKPGRDGSLPWWAITDSRALLMNKLHYFRRSEYCRDIIVLISDRTPQKYRDYLDEREYEYIVTGEDRVDLKHSLDRLAASHGAETFLVDAGRGLTNALINDGLVDRVSLLVIPTVLGTGARNLFGDVDAPQKLKLAESKEYPGGHLWLLYDFDK